MFLPILQIWKLEWVNVFVKIAMNLKIQNCELQYHCSTKIHFLILYWIHQNTKTEKQKCPDSLKLTRLQQLVIPFRKFSMLVMIVEMASNQLKTYILLIGALIILLRSRSKILCDENYLKPDIFLRAKNPTNLPSAKSNHVQTTATI